MNKVTFITLLVALASCKEISFENPQPVGRKKLLIIPKSLQGKYLTHGDNGELSKDTVIITANGYYFGYFDPVERLNTNEEYEKGVLSDSLVLKDYKGYYFLNINARPEWLLRVIKQKENGDLIYLTPQEKGTDFKEYMRKLSAEIKIDSIVLQEKTLYQIDPTPTELLSLIEKGFFAPTRLTKIK